MDQRKVNVLVANIPGDGLPSTYSIPISRSASIDDLWDDLYERLPPVQSRLILTTLGNRQLPRNALGTIESLLTNPQNDFVPLRLSIPVLGGKGGFGSQLRAAGGRMASKRKKNQEEDNGSSRNLDGRRLRTVTEAKSLAEYLAIKPEMDRKEKEKRRQRWENIVEMAEKKEDEIKSGGKGRLNGKWVEDKEEASERTRAAVMSAMKNGQFVDNIHIGTSAGSSTSAASDSCSNSNEGAEDDADARTSSGPDSPVLESSSAFAKPNSAMTSGKGKGKSSVFFAFDDEDDEFLSSDGEGDEGDSV